VNIKQIFIRLLLCVILIYTTGCSRNTDSFSLSTELFKTYRNVHALKSALANIGETKLSGFACELEDAGRAGNAAFIAEKTSVFINELLAVVNKLKHGTEEYSADDIYFSGINEGSVGE
jgi:hypothetical protein